MTERRLGNEPRPAPMRGDVLALLAFWLAMRERPKPRVKPGPPPPPAGGVVVGTSPPGSGKWVGRKQYELQTRRRRALLERTLPQCVPLSVRGVDLSWWRN